MNATNTQPEQASHNGIAALAGALAVLLPGAVVVSVVDLGPLAGHMALHIASMNIAAPLLAVLLRPPFSGRWGASPAVALWLATSTQMALLWTAHVPAVHHLAQAHPAAVFGLQAALFLTALAFWTCIVEAMSNVRWHAMFALLLCGKLACLLGALLIFAPRPLFTSPGGDHAMHHGPADQAMALADQHLAGLLMVAACPLSYVLTAVVLAARTMSRLERCALPAGAPLAGR
jgi:putative membrane protein